MASDGATVTFLIGDKLARETGSWDNANLSVLNLTYVTPPTPVATGSPSASTTPRGPNTGTGLEQQGSSEGSLLLLLTVIGLGAAAFGTAGVAVARKSR